MLGREACERLQDSSVTVVGLGAVGSYATEGLARADALRQLRQQLAHRIGGELDALAQPLAGEREPLGVGRLQQIVDRALFEGLDGVLVVRGDEHDVRPARQRARRLDAVHRGHVDVEEDDVRLEALRERDGLAAVGGLADDHELRPDVLEAADDLLAHQALVVGDERGRGGRVHARAS
jgi:hypothetical protein